MNTTLRANSRIIFWLLLLALATGLSGCALTPHLDAHWGESVRNAQRHQTLHPLLRSEHDDPEGMDGRAAEALMNRYYKSFEDPPKPAAGNTGGLGSGR